MEFPQKHGGAPRLYTQRTRPCSATELLSSSHFPEEFQGNLLVENVIGFQGILRYRLVETGASFTAEELEPILSSSDPSFRPVDVEVGPDGAIYFADWQNPVIGHMQHNLRDPSRDQSHGRIYRVTYKGRSLIDPVRISGEPVEKLLQLLQSPEDRVRYRARIELSGRDSDEVLAAAKEWLANLDPSDALYEHHLLEGLWLHQQHNRVNEPLLQRVLESPEFRARAAATRVLCDWRDRVPGSLDRIRQMADDPEPRVRMEAVRAASFFTVPEAIEVVVVAEQHPSDLYLEYVALETRKVLDPIWKAAVASQQTVPVKTMAGASFLIRNMPLEQLLAQERTLAVNAELMCRSGVPDAVRRTTLTSLAKQQNQSELRTLFDLLPTLDQDSEAYDASVVFDLMRLLSGRPASELQEVRGELEAFAREANQAAIRQASLIALMTVDGTSDHAWKLASGNAHSLHDLVLAMPRIFDPSLQAALYERVEPLLDGLPEHMPNQHGAARFVRIELPRPGTLTLAEVEIFSDGVNIAPQGSATQSTTEHAGHAGRAIDGNTSGDFGNGGQTHTIDNSHNPWWEIDLGQDRVIDKVVIYNRTSGFGKRLDGFTLKVLDHARNDVFVVAGQPAPDTSAEIAVESTTSSQVLRRAAMNAMVSVPGREMETFRRLAPLVRVAADQTYAIRALQRIPRDLWPADEAKPLLEAIVAHVGMVPPAERTTPAALEALEFADSLATLLPGDEAKLVRAQLREIGVRVIKIGTLPERMRFDREVIAVQAGKPVEFLFENYDTMPHNLVIAKPGSLEELGQMAEATAQSPDAAQRQFVPKSGKVLRSSSLIQPGNRQQLSFTAPTQPGVYPYVCTYPGHWRRMYGVLYVVDDLDAYLADPASYVASHPLPIQDELLKDLRPRTEWTLDELADSVADLRHGRSFSAGSQMFKRVNCASCHKLNCEGVEVGPDLTRLDPTYQPLDVLRHILEPSAKIDPKYQTYSFLFENGTTLTGMIVAEDDATVKVIENPLAQAEAKTFKKSDIDEQIPSPVSIMPKGLLDKLTRDEVLDLLAYVLAGGRVNHVLFEHAGEGAHQHD